MLQKCSFVILLFFQHFSCLAQSSWTAKPNLPKGRTHAVAFGIGNYGYVTTGVGHNSLLNDLWRFDPENSIWQEMEPIPSQGRYRAISFTINNSGYVLCGAMDDMSQWGEVWEFNSETGHWSQKPQFPFKYHCCVEDLIGFAIMKKGYVYSNNWAQLFCFDPLVNKWTQLQNSLIPATTSRQGFTINDKFYLGLGFRDTDFCKDFWEYNPISDTWSKKADFPGKGRGDAVSFTINNTGYFGLGRSQGGIIQCDFWAYNPDIDTWRQVDSLNYFAEYAVGFNIGDKGYVGTGMQWTTGPFFWQYDPASSGVPFIIENRNVRLFPNPVNSILYVESNSTSLESIRVVALSGKNMVVITGNVTKLDVADFSPGIYFIQIRTKEGVTFHKFIKN